MGDKTFSDVDLLRLLARNLDVDERDRFI